MKKSSKFDVAPWVDESKVPDILTLMRMTKLVHSLKRKYPEVFEELYDLTQRINTLIDDSERAVRNMNVSCGPFENYCVVLKFDEEKIYNVLGDRMFRTLGGKKETIQQFTVDREAIKSAIDLGKISEEKALKFTTIQKKYHKPEKLRLP